MCTGADETDRYWVSGFGSPPQYLLIRKYDKHELVLEGDHATMFARLCAAATVRLMNADDLFDSLFKRIPTQES